MTGRDDFSSKTIRTLQFQSAFICANPRCKILTVAPSISAEDKFRYIGKVAHISAAAADGPRYLASMSVKERKSINNAIFLCSNCADMIDKNNGLGYKIDDLKKWKADHLEWVSLNLNKSIVSRNNINNILTNFNQQYSNIENNVTVNFFPEKKINEDKEHDISKFKEANAVLDESLLLKICQSLIDNASFYSKHEKLIEIYRKHLGMTGNSYIDKVIDHSKNELINALGLLVEDFIQFDMYPYNQKIEDGNFKIMFKPALIHGNLYHQPDNEERSIWTQLFTEFKKHVEDVQEKYEKYRRAIKISLHV